MAQGYTSGRAGALGLALIVSALLLASTAGPAMAKPGDPLLTTSITASNGAQATEQGIVGASVTLTNTLSTDQQVLVIGTTINSLGQTIGFSIQGSTIPAGGSVGFFFSAPSGGKGTFTIAIFATTSTLVPLSASTPVTVTE